MSDEKKKCTDWDRGFLEFINSDQLPPPGSLTESIKDTVSQELRPVLWKIFSKLAALQAAWALFTLFVCPQFKIGFAQHDHLAHFTHPSDGIGFMVVCGMLFLSGGAAAAPFFLNQTEMKAIEKSVFLYFPTAALFAVLCFFSVGADITGTRAMPWFLGGVLGSVIGFEMVSGLRLRLRGDRGTHA